jgi:hypothetical protein
VLLQASGDQVTRRFQLSREDVTAHNGEWHLDTERIDLK